MENSDVYTRDKDTRHAAIRAVTEEKYSDVRELYCVRTFPQFSSSVLAGEQFQNLYHTPQTLKSNQPPVSTVPHPKIQPIEDCVYWKKYAYNTPPSPVQTHVHCKTNVGHYFCFSPSFLEAKILFRFLSVRENKGRSFIKMKWHKPNFQKVGETFIFIRKNWKVHRLEKQMHSTKLDTTQMKG